MNHLQEKLYGILIDVTEFCDSNNIAYFLAFGTLLGAVRHRGFIPWDDDIDIVMRREEYERFAATYQSSKYRLLKPGKKGYCYPFIKVSDDTVKIKEKLVNNKSSFGYWIDVFPLDYWPESSEKQDKLIKKIEHLKMLWAKKARPLSTKSGAKWLLLLLLKVLLFPLPMGWLCKRMDKLSREIPPSTLLLESVWEENYKSVLNYSWLDRTVELRFENRDFQSIANYNEWLMACYGDYTVLPKREYRVSNHEYEIVGNASGD